MLRALSRRALMTTPAAQIAARPRKQSLDVDRIEHVVRCTELTVDPDFTFLLQGLDEFGTT